MRFLARKKQKGATLLEIIAFLGLAGLISGGVLSMFLGASATQAGNQLIASTSGIRSAVRSLYNASANYGAANMLATLSTGNQLPSTWTSAGAGPAMTATHELNGAAGVTGQNANFAVTYDAIPADVCVQLVTQQGNQGWVNVFIGAATGNAAPLAAGAPANFLPETISASCAGGNKKITLVSR